jgi:hypothetical protein
MRLVLVPAHYRVGTRRYYVPFFSFGARIFPSPDPPAPASSAGRYENSRLPINLLTYRGAYVPLVAHAIVDAKNRNASSVGGYPANC